MSISTLLILDHLAEGEYLIMLNNLKLLVNFVGKLLGFLIKGRQIAPEAWLVRFLCQKQSYCYREASTHSKKLLELRRSQEQKL